MNEVVELRDAEQPTAFDRHANGYDDVALSALGRVFRERVRAHLRPLVTRGQRVLDLGCGTGLDAVWFAEQGCRVVGIDASPAMIDITQAKAAASAEVAQRVNAVVADLATVNLVELADQLPPADADDSGQRCFDLVLANFGVINCVDHLDELGQRLARATSGDATIVIVSMSPVSLTERAQAVASRNRSLWHRRQAIDLRTDAEVDGYRGLDVWYHSAADVSGAMAPHFETMSAESIGVVLPTFEQRRLVEARPRLLSVLRWADEKLGPMAARSSIGDHHIVTLGRRR